MNSEEIKKELFVINSLSHEQMAELYRFAPLGHKYFSNQHPELLNAFSLRFKNFGSMTQNISKSIGLKKG